jgi:Heavy metal binding domain
LTTLLRGVKTAAGVLAAAIAIAAAAQPPTVTIAYICPMHPDVVSRTAGGCPRCGMALVLADPYDAREFLVDVTPAPAAPRPGAITRLRLTVREPRTRAVVRDLVEVHEKPYHLFVISQDLEHYDHVHPERRADGSYTVDVRLPKAGFYRLYSDFLPLGGTPQVVPSTIATAGFGGTLAAGRARLVPDQTLTKTAAGMRVTLTLPAEGLVAGRDEKLHYHVVDASSGAPLTDLEPYLAAFGHTLVLSEDTLQYVHAHPLEWLPDRGPLQSARAGPDLTFRALLPKPGRYRIWTQVKRQGVVSTVAFTVTAKSPAG